MMEMFITIGPSGSGKTTWCNNNMGCGDVYSADHYFEELADKVGALYEEVFSVQKLGNAHAQCFRRASEALHAFQSPVAVANTHTRESEVSPYILLAHAYGYSVRVVAMVAAEDVSSHGLTETPCEAWIERCWRRNHHGVPRDAVRAQARRAYKLRNRWPRHWPKPLLVTS